jgi:hypothetical protein
MVENNISSSQTHDAVMKDTLLVDLWLTATVRMEFQRPRQFLRPGLQSTQNRTIKSADATREYNPGRGAYGA